MISYEKICDKSRVFRCLTSLNPQEFDNLLEKFEIAYNDYLYETQVKGRPRQRKLGGGRKPVLKTTEDKLLFILFYFKVYPLQEVLAFLFGMSQPQANEWIHKLTLVLNRALGYEMHLPERNPANLVQVLERCPGLQFMIDGTERRIQRPKDKEKQKEFYSGKKKTHTKKNNVIIDANTQQIKYLSGTHAGKKHDKKICDEEDYHFPNNSQVLQDSGFQGFEQENVTTIQPKKKPRGGELSEAEKQRNTEISRVRVKIEHVIGKVKICRIVKDVFRNYKKNYDDLVMEISCGLYNFRASFRYA